MSAEAGTAGRLAAAVARPDPRTARVYRYAAGSTLAMAVALGIDWRLSFLAPVLTLSFLGSPAPRPPLRAGLGFVAVVAVAAAAGLALTVLLLPYPALTVLLIGLSLFLLFYHGARGAPALLVMMLMVAVTVIPVVGLQSLELAALVAQGLVLGAVVAIVVVWAAHAMFPDPPVGGAAAAAATPPALPPPRHAAVRAGLNTLVVLPVVVLYLAFGLTSVLILVFIALLSMQPDFSQGFKAGKALIVGNTMGGLAAIAMYELLVMVPQFGFMLILTLGFGLAFGSRLFSGKPAAPLYGMAFSTLILVIASTTSMFGDAQAKAWTRVIQITVAVLYLVLAFGVIQRLRRKPETSNASA